MEEQVKEARIHPWIYYIASVERRLIFSAFCKVCRTYFAEDIPLPYNGDPGKFFPSTLPRYGCVPISEDFMI